MSDNTCKIPKISAKNNKRSGAELQSVTDKMARSEHFRPRYCVPEPRSPLTLQNQYSPLQCNDNDMMDVTVSNNSVHQRNKASGSNGKRSHNNETQKQAAAPKTYTTRPIVITDERVNKMDALMELINAAKLEGEYFKKFTSLGVKISFLKDKDYDSFSAILIAQEVEHYSFKPRAQNTFKAIMSGLLKTSTEQIKSEFGTLYNITVINIIDLNENKQTAYGLYLIEFKSDMNLKTLKDVRYIDHTVISWRRYSPRNKGPTQCRRCGIYGHGQNNCHRKLVCIACAQDHLLSDCPFGAEQNKTATGVVFKCFSCAANKKQANHRADDPNCPSRSEYLAIRQRITQKNSRSNQPKQVVPTKQAFPRLNPNSQQMPQNVVRPLISYADISASTPMTSVNENLFTIDELFDIFCAHVDQFNSCKTKMDQIKVVASLLKYGAQ